MKKNSYNLLLSAAILVLLSSCGPMNSKPADPNTPPANTGTGLGGNNGTPRAEDSTAYSNNQTFLVQARLKNPKGEPITKAATGENQLKIRVIHAESFLTTSPEATVTIEYFRTNSTTQKKFTATAQRQADGSFTASLTFKKAGTWTLEIHVTDGALKDDHTVLVIF